MNLELHAVLWLANFKRCMVVVRELSPRTAYCGQPDAYGVTAARFGIEVEVKRSMSDFYADKAKHSRRNRDIWGWAFPKEFYYLMPLNLAQKATSSLPEWAGLIGADPNFTRVLVKAPINRLSKKLTIKECIRLVQQMAIYSTRIEQKMDASVTAWKNGCEPYYWAYSI